MLKIGLAGARSLKGVLGFRSIPDVEITALCDLDEDLLKRESEKNSIEHTYRVFEDMLDSDIDAVVIGTPMQCHVPQAIAALDAGKHVMSEVTAGVTMDELYWLMESVERSGRIYMYAENYCYMPQNQIMKELSRQGYLGELYYAEGEYLHKLEDRYYWTQDGKTKWRQYWQMGKRGTFYPTHSLGPLMQCMPEEQIAEVSTFSPGHFRNKSYLRQDDGSTSMCVTQSGKLVQIRVDCLSPRPHKGDYYLVQGTKGIYEASRMQVIDGNVAFATEEDPEGYLKWKSVWDYNHLLPERYREATPEQKAAGHSGGDFFIIQDFVDAIRTNTQPELNVYKACEWTAVGLLSEISVVNGGRAMRMPRFAPKDESRKDYGIIL